MPSPISEHIVGWPEAEAERFAAAGYWAGVPLGDLLREAAERTPDAPALIDDAAGARLTHAELAARADATAVRLLDLGFAPGHRLIMQLANGWEFVVLTYACLRIGVVPVMALTAHRRSELTYLARHAEATAIAVPDVLRDFDHQELAQEIGPSVREATGEAWHVLVAGEHIAPGSVDLRTLCGPSDDPPADRARLTGLGPHSRDVAVFLLSGGTTGLPKLIARTHDDYAYNARASAEVAGVGASTVYLVGLPAGHNFPLACPGILGTLLAGGRVVMLPSPEPARAFATIAAEGVTHTAVVPAVAGRWLEHVAEHGAKDLASLRVLQVGGARLADNLARRIRPTLGATLQQVFGMAEGLLNFTRLDDSEEVICTTQGRALCPDDEVRLVDELDADVPRGEPGSLLTRGPYTPRGYYRAGEQNAWTFTPDGWYRSGDICRMTPEGDLIVEGRDKDMINRGGEKVSAEEVENFVYQIPGVSQVAAVAMPDPVLGERVCVYVVPRQGATVTLEQIRESMEHLGVARFKLPEQLRVVEELKFTKVGKIDKKALRADLTERSSPARAGKTTTRHDTTTTLAWMREGTAHLLRCVDKLDDTAFAVPSRLPDWTRAHVVGHVARNAEALTRLATWARTGVETPMYADRAERAAEIEESAARPPATLRSELASTAETLEDALAALTSEQWAAPVRSALGRKIPAAEIPWMRVREVWLHTIDLDTGVSFADLPEDLVDLLLEDVTAILTRKDGCPALTLAPTDRSITWDLGTTPAEDTVEAPAAEIAGWVTGRVHSGGRPPLPTWL